MLSRSVRYATQVVLALVSVLVVAHTARHVAALTNPVLEFDVGPNTGSYLEGFTESEERVPVTFRWTRERASVALPLAGTGPNAVLQLRFARFLDGNASVRLFVDGDSQGVFSARSGRFRTLELPLKLRGEPPKITLLVEDPDPERLGIAIDWLRIENARWRVPATTLRPTVLLTGVFLLTLALRFSLPRAVGLGAIVAVLQAGWFAHDPFAMVHAHEQLTAIGLSSAALVALVSVTIRRARVLPLLFLLGYFLKRAALFHPSARDFKFRPLFYSLRQEVLKVEREVTDKHLGEFLNVADVRRAFPAAAMVWKAEGPKIAGLRFAAESGVQPGVVGFTAEDSEGLSPFLDAEVVEAAVGVQGALKIRGGRFDVHTRRDAAEAGALRSSGS